MTRRLDEMANLVSGYREILSIYLRQLSKRSSQIVHLVAGFSSILYIFVFTNLQTSLLVAAGHDDGWFIFHAYSIVSGHWLGPYNQYTLMKGPGYPLFLAFTSLFHIPVTLAHSLLWCSSVWLLAVATKKIFHSTWLSIIVLEIVLWNFGPHAMRVVRDEITTPQALGIIALVMLAFRSSPKVRNLHLSLAGTLFGWFWITREDGIILLPGLLLLLGGLLWSSYDGVHRLRSLASLIFFFFPFAGVRIVISEINFLEYRAFTVVDFSSSFEAALESLESITPDRDIPHELVTQNARFKAYEVSPTFALLRYSLEDSSSPVTKWKVPSCGFYPEMCGEYGAWFMWAFRDAVAQTGYYNDARISYQFYSAIHREIDNACASGRLRCSRSLIPFLPHVNEHQIESGIKPLKRLINLITFHEAPMPARVDSTGTDDQMQLAVVLLNLPFHTRPPQLMEGTSSEISVPAALHVRNWIIRVYAKLMGPLLALGLLATFALISFIALDKTMTIEALVIFSAWLFAGCRIVSLVLVDVSAFPAIFNMYLSYAYNFSGFAAAASLFYVGSIMQDKWRLKMKRAKPGEN